MRPRSSPPLPSSPDVLIESDQRVWAGRLERIGTYMLTAGGADETCALYVGRVQAPATGADGIAWHAGEASEEEDIRVRVWPAAKAIEATLDGQFTNSITAIGLLWLAARRDSLQRRWLAP